MRVVLFPVFSGPEEAVRVGFSFGLFTRHDDGKSDGQRDVRYSIVYSVGWRTSLYGRAFVEPRVYPAESH